MIDLSALAESPRMDALVRAAAARMPRAAVSSGGGFFVEQARPDQQPPEGDWFVWLLMGGRGAGKTRTVAEQSHAWAAEDPRARIALVGQTKGDVRDVMIEGESGLLNCGPPGFRPNYISTRRRVEWPNGALGFVYSGDEPDQLRGPQHSKAAVDELAKYRYAQETWDNLELGLRLGDHPQAIVATTPRPIAILRSMIKDPEVVVTSAPTEANRANLPERFLRRVYGRYAGTRLGRQELEGILLEDYEGALWSLDLIDAYRIAEQDMPDLRRIVVALDPSVTAHEGSAECGIVAAGLGPAPGASRFDRHGYVLRDHSDVLKTHVWARRAVALLKRLDADAIVAEVNNGGDLVEESIRSVDARVKVKQVRASRGKVKRAEPVAALYEQGRVHHMVAAEAGSGTDLSVLEEQLTRFLIGGEIVPDENGQESSDRADALVWALHELMLGEAGLTRGIWANVA